MIIMAMIITTTLKMLILLRIKGWFFKIPFRHQPLEKRNADLDLGGHQLSITRCTKIETIASSPKIKIFQLMNI